VFRQLLDSVPLSTDDGVLLRRVVIEVGAMHLVLNCLGIFSSQQPLQRRDTLSAILGGNSSGASTSLPVAAVNNHPAKRSSAHHMLFTVTTSTTCQEIMQNCVSGEFLATSFISISPVFGSHILFYALAPIIKLFYFVYFLCL